MIVSSSAYQRRQGGGIPQGVMRGGKDEKVQKEVYKVSRTKRDIFFLCHDDRELVFRDA